MPAAAVRRRTVVGLPTNVSVQYRIAAGTATAGVDVDTARSLTRTLLFRVDNSGRTPVFKRVVVQVLPDTAVEPDETFTVDLSNATGATIRRGTGRGTGVGTIPNDDPITSGVGVSTSDGSVVEGNAGRRAIMFTVALSERATSTVSVDDAITPMTASRGTDFVAPAITRRLTFLRGTNGFTAIAKMVTVPVLPDTTTEGNETFALVLSNPSVGVLLADSTGTGTIIDDESVRRRLMGTAVRSATLAQEPAYADIAGSRFDLLTPENEMKWSLVEPQRGVFDFTASDAIVNFAVAHGHTLAWHQQNPAWLTGGGFTRGDLIDILTNHITTTVGRYRNARSKLYINDYSIEGPSRKADALYAVVSGMVARGVPIDGVGFQTHRTLGSITVPGLGSQFDRYAALGLDVAITELDVRVPVPASTQDLAAQADTYAVACVAASNCQSITTWGLTDKHSWIPYFFTGLVRRCRGTRT